MQNIKRINIFCLVSLFVLLSSCRKSDGGGNSGTEPVNPNYPGHEQFTALANKYTAKGIPGISIALHSSLHGSWGYAGGFAKKETNTPLTLNQFYYLNSATKIYMGTAIMMMKEDGLIDINKPVTHYLPAKYSKYISDAEGITVNQLLIHRSGIPDYTNETAYFTFVLEQPEQVMRPEELLAFIGNKPLNFTPGAHFQYSNTNYLLLALICDAITGDHAAFIRKNILQPLKISETLYHGDKGYLDDSRVISSYWDPVSSGEITNVSAMQMANVKSMSGDDGMVTTPFAAIGMLRGLFEGKLVSQQTLTEMTTWTTDENGAKRYAPGLQYLDLGEIAGIGHGGSGIGSSCGLYYIAEKKLYIWLGTNFGTVMEGPLTDELDAFRTEFLKLLMKMS